MNLDNIKKILDYEEMILVGHKNPDGDAIGSTIALALGLKKIGKSPVVMMKKYPDIYNILQGTEMIKSKVDANKTFDLFISLDCGDAERFENEKEYFKNAKTTINIDHHISNPMFAHYNYVGETASSTCECVYYILKELNVPLDTDIASALFAGIISDTAVFKNQNTTSETYRIVAELMEYNIPFYDLINTLFFTKTLKETKLLAMALNKVELMLDNKLSYSSLSIKEMKIEDCDCSDTSSIVSFLKQIQGVEIAIFLCEIIPNNIKVSMRTETNLDLAEIAVQLGGGGHVKAAGAVVKGRMEDVKEKVLDLIKSKIYK